MKVSAPMPVAVYGDNPHNLITMPIADLDAPTCKQITPKSSFDGVPSNGREYLWPVIAAFLLRLAYVLIARTYHFELVVIDPGPKTACDVHFRFAFEIGSIARSIAAGHGFASPFGGDTGPTAWIAPVYPYLLAGIFKVFGTFTDASGFAIQVFGSGFASLVSAVIYFIGLRTVGRIPGLVASWMWAAFPFFWRWSSGSFIWDSPLSALLVSLIFLSALILTDDNRGIAWVRFGVLWGIAALTNPALLTILPVTLAWPAYRLSKSRKQWLKPVLVAGISLIVTITPWLIRNRVVFGQFVFIRSNLPFELHLSNYHYSNAMGWFGKHPTQNRIQRDQYIRQGELAYVTTMGKEFQQFLREHPAEFVELTWKRFLAFWDGGILYYLTDPWQPWMIILESALALSALVVAGIRKVFGTVLYCGVLLFYPLTYYVAAPALRYRYAIEPLMLLFTMYFVVEATKTIRSRMRRAEA
jgi:Dolichyl-phosphate-mannose-protein mannosyltransferase